MVSEAVGDDWVYGGDYFDNCHCDGVHAGVQLVYAHRYVYTRRTAEIHTDYDRGNIWPHSGHFGVSEALF